EDIAFAVPGAVFEAHGLRLDRDAALALEFHIVENLLAHFARFKPAAGLDQPVGERRFAVIDMRNDREIADEAQRGHASRKMGWVPLGINATGARYCDGRVRCWPRSVAKDYFGEMTMVICRPSIRGIC